MPPSADTVRTVFEIVGNVTSLVLFLSPVTLILIINGAGFLIELAYVLVLLSFSAGGAWFRSLAALVGEFVFAGSIAGLILEALHGDNRRLVAGVLCVVFATAMYAAPLSVMVIHTRSVEFMPLSLPMTWRWREMGSKEKEALEVNNWAIETSRPLDGLAQLYY
ncbi:hypothetical protein ZIOFF_072334 [Zingiber officinale]|uniref:Uncharacterized protein n=1 Tax=Zingiber officinale TaxID=94328 RepID=A0A8J5ETX0_ZINOF|nr:hypothetical protein ZIOFF_072334 [Zingiber officinale]